MELRVSGGNQAGNSIQVEDELVFGRSEAPPGNLGDDPELSRRHARIRVTDQGAVIEDLGSRNGTLVNGEQIQGERVLAPGDKIQLGDTTVELDGSPRTQVRTTSPPTRMAAQQAPPPVAPPPPSAPPRQPGPGPGFTPPPHAATEKKKTDRRIPILAVLVLLLAAAAVIGFATGGDDDTATDTAASAAGADTAGWVYAVSNIGPGEQNSVLAVDYRADGTMAPLRVREFQTKGTGGKLVPGKSLGRLAGDTQVTVSPDQRFLFAVNQGSDTVAVFRIDRSTGTLEHVEGSPFPSGGKAPVSTGFNGRHLVVANKGILPGEELPGDPAQTNYASFEVSDEGSLTPVNTLPAAPGAGATAAVFSPNNRVVFGAEFLGFSLNSMTIGEDGRLAQAPGSPTKFPDSISRGRRGPGGETGDMLKIPYGVAVHPTEPFVYYIAAASARIATYRYDENTGRLTFVGQVDNPKTIASCWARVTSDGRFLYTGNSGSLNVTAYRIADGGARLERIELQQGQTKSTIANIAFDATEKRLFAIGTSDSPDFPLGPRAAPANSFESYSIAEDGSLDPIGSVTLPVPTTTFPAGLAMVERDGE